MDKLSQEYSVFNKHNINYYSNTTVIQKKKKKKKKGREKKQDESYLSKHIAISVTCHDNMSFTALGVASSLKCLVLYLRNNNNNNKQTTITNKPQ